MKSHYKKISAFIALSAMFFLTILKVTKIDNQNNSFFLGIVINNLPNLIVAIGLPYFVFNLRLRSGEAKTQNLGTYIALSFTGLILFEVFQFVALKNPHDLFDIAAIVIGTWIAGKLKSLFM